MVPVTGNPSFFVGIDFDAQENTIFFSDTSIDMIYKQKIDGTGEKWLKKIFVCFVFFNNNATNLFGKTSKHSLLKQGSLLSVLNTFRSGK